MEGACSCKQYRRLVTGRRPEKQESIGAQPDRAAGTFPVGHPHIKKSRTGWKAASNERLISRLNT